MTLRQHTVHSVYISRDTVQSVYIGISWSANEAAEWCAQVIGNAKIDVVTGEVLAARLWSWRAGRIYNNGIPTNCCVFTFVNSRHKLLFDIRWGHLGIHDSVQLCTAAIKAKQRTIT